MSSRNRCVIRAVLAIGVLATSVGVGVAGPLDFFHFLCGRGVDLKQHDCNECGDASDTECVVRRPVVDCVKGKKEVLDCNVRCEYVSIPETRYHWRLRCITKEIPCPYCQPVCTTDECQHCVGQEVWRRYGAGCGESGCDEQCARCAELHCRQIEPRLENLPTARCDHEPGETTIRVRYWSCVKEPYTVYRQVARPVCVAQPHYETVKVPVTTYVCERCEGAGCSHCNGRSGSGAPCDE